MQQELIKQVVEMFNNEGPEKWKSFLELMSQRDVIRNTWHSDFRQALDNCFTKNTVKDWSFSWLNRYTAHWYLTEFGNQSLSILFANGQLSLHVNEQIYKIEKIRELLCNAEYSPILACFNNRIDARYVENIVAIEKGNFYFDSPYDGRIDEERLEWYEGNKTEEYVKQVQEKVNRFRSEEITKLLKEINELPEIKLE